MPVLVPIPTLPPWVRIERGARDASLVVWCDRCKRGEALYMTVLHKDPAALGRAVAIHEGCEP